MKTVFDRIAALGLTDLEARRCWPDIEDAIIGWLKFDAVRMERALEDARRQRDREAECRRGEGK